MRLCLLLWVLADKALTHITHSSTDHSQSIIPEDGEGGEVGREKRREERPEIVECLPLFFCSTLFPPGAMTKAGWKGAHCRTDGIICHCLYLFPSASLSYSHTHTHSFTLSLFLLPSAPGLCEMRHQTTAFLSKLSQPAYTLWSDCSMTSQSPCTLIGVHISSPRLINISIAQTARNSTPKMRVSLFRASLKVLWSLH